MNVPQEKGNPAFPCSPAFTLAEMLLTLAIMALLIGAGIPAASDMLRHSRQATLDRMARTLYMSAQMSLTAAKLSGNALPDLQTPETAGLLLTLPAADAPESDLPAFRCRLCKADVAESTPAQDLQELLFPRLSPEGALRAVSGELFEGYWIVTFNPADYSMANAYFVPNDGETGKGTAYFQTLWAMPGEERDGKLSELSSVKARLRDGARIGYYGGKSVPAAPIPVGQIGEGVEPSPDNPSDGSPPNPMTAFPDAPAPLKAPAPPDGGEPVAFEGQPQESAFPDIPDTPDDPGAEPSPYNPNLLTPDDTATKKTPVNDPDKAANAAHKLYCWIGDGENPNAPICNGDALATRLNCWVPADSAFASGSAPCDVDFILTVKGVSSMKTVTFRYGMYFSGIYTQKTESGAYESLVHGSFCREETRTAQENGAEKAIPGWLYSYPVVLDSLTDDGAGVPLHQNRPFKARFPDFIPGEDIMLCFEIDVGGEIKKAAKKNALAALSDNEKAAYGLARMSEEAVANNASPAYDWLWKCHLPGRNEYPVSNSLFADAYRDGRREYRSPVDGGGAYGAKIACRRHLQNLDAQISGLGGNLGGIKSYDNTDIGAESVRALQIADIDLSAGGAAFTPISNGKLAKYNGGGHSIDNLRVNLPESCAPEELEERKDKGAGLFGTLGGAATLENLALTDPAILAKDTRCVGGLVGKAENLTVSSVRLYMSPKSYGGAAPGDVSDKWLVGGERVGGLIGYASGDVVITTAADGVPSFAATFVNASAPRAENVYAGGLAGYVAGKLTVRGAWADCYVSAEAGVAGHIGGLAGYCGAESEFRRCYSVGFALKKGDAASVAAGFAPCGVASVSDAYSAFNFDALDPERRTDVRRYDMFRSADSAADAYCAYGGAVSPDGAAIPVIDSDSLKNVLTAEHGFRVGEPETFPYFPDDTPRAPYPYPTLDGAPYAHYNDYLVTKPPKLRSVTVRNPRTFSRAERKAFAAELAQADGEDAKAALYDKYLILSRNGSPQSVPMLEQEGRRYAEARTENRGAYGDRFIGWHTEENFWACLSALAAGDPAPKVLPVRYWAESGVRDADASNYADLLDKDAKLLLDGDAPVLYALYERAEPFAVAVENRRFDKERMNAALRALLAVEAPQNPALQGIAPDGDLTQNETLQRLLQGGYEGVTLHPDDWDDNTHRLMREAFQGELISLQSIDVDPVAPTYAPASEPSPFLPDAQASGVGKAAYCARFDAEGAFLQFVAVSQDAFGTIPVETDRPSVYVALYPDEPITLSVGLVFRLWDDPYTWIDMGIYGSPEELRESQDFQDFQECMWWEEVEWRAVINISAQAGTTLRQNVAEWHFDGFALNETESILDAVIRPGVTDALVLYYDYDDAETGG